MAALTHVQSMIDYCLIRYGSHVKNVADARANILAWMQGAEESLYVAAPWSWREWEVDPFSFTAGVYIYSLDTAIGDVLDIENASGDMMDKVPPRIFRNYYRNHQATGIPKRWSFDPNDENSQALTLLIWPTPAAGQTTCRLIAEQRAQTLADTTASYSRFPLGRRIVVCYKTLKEMAIHEGKRELQQDIQQDIDGFLAGLSAKDREHFKGRL